MERPFVGNHGELLEDGHLLGPVSYRVEVSQVRVAAGNLANPHATVPGLGRVAGKIASRGPGVDLYELAIRNPKLTLRFPEGEWKCWLTSSDGTLAGGSVTLHGEAA